MLSRQNGVEDASFAPFFISRIKIQITIPISQIPPVSQIPNFIPAIIAENQSS